MGFELPVRSEEFAFEFSVEIRASLGKLGLREDFAPEMLDVNIRLVSAVRFQLWSRVRGVTKAAITRRQIF